jgi:hypothetical protein
MTDRARLIEIAGYAKSPASPGMERRLLLDLWEAIHGKLPKRNRGGRNPENLFIGKLDAEAWESAAVQLMPIGRGWIMGNGMCGGDSQLGGAAIHSDLSGDREIAASDGPTPAMALIAAICEARALNLPDPRS